MKKNKKLKIIGIITFICVVAIFAIYKVDSVNQTKQRVVDRTKYLMDAISNEDYDKIKSCVKKTDGTELSDQEISNFLLNTELYRAIMINDEEPSFTYSTNVNFLNTNKGTVLFSYNALDGDKITNQLQYIRSGEYEYFITDKIEESKINMKKYPIAINLANGENINVTESEENISQKIKILSYVKDENESVYVEVIEDAIDDIKMRLLDTVKDRNEFLKDNYKDCYIEWNQDKSMISIYYDESMENKVFNNFMKLEILSFSYLNQVLDGNEDWHLTIKYFDCQTKELLKTDTIR